MDVLMDGQTLPEIFLLLNIYFKLAKSEEVRNFKIKKMCFILTRVFAHDLTFCVFVLRIICVCPGQPGC
jgi:hypothetical protein